MRNWDIFSLEKRIYELEKRGGASPVSSITFEVVSETSVTLVDNTDHTITVTKEYANPFVFAANALPKSSWGGVIAASNPTYNATNHTITFHYNSSDNTLPSGQAYDVDWFVIDLPIPIETKSRKRKK